MPQLPPIFSKRSTASADDLEKQAGAARKASMLESMEMAEAIEMLHISAESVVSFTVLLRSSRTQEVKELLLGVGELDLTLREPAPAGGRASRTPMLTFPIDDLVAWLPSDTRFTFYVPLADDDARQQGLAARGALGRASRRVRDGRVGGPGSGGRRAREGRFGRRRLTLSAVFAPLFNNMHVPYPLAVQQLSSDEF